MGFQWSFDLTFASRARGCVGREPQIRSTKIGKSGMGRIGCWFLKVVRKLRANGHIQNSYPDARVLELLGGCRRRPWLR
jgi:hypothetical protein